MSYKGAIDRSGITGRAMPKLGELAEERAVQHGEALAWGLSTGAARTIVQAYRRARQRGESELTAFNAAADAALALGRSGQRDCPCPDRLGGEGHARLSVAVSAPWLPAQAPKVLRRMARLPEL